MCVRKIIIFFKFHTYKRQQSITEEKHFILFCVISCAADVEVQVLENTYQTSDGPTVRDHIYYTV